jgi:NAD(P)-dependent dehydrogenase (short-subunit alcohol dehydrogenase family)
MKGHMMEWRNQVAVVTGGARGLGRATARLLAQRGAAVCVNYAVHADAAEAVVAEIATARGRAIAVAADVAEPAAVETMVTRTEAEPRNSVNVKYVTHRGKKEAQTDCAHLPLGPQTVFPNRV